MVNEALFLVLSTTLSYPFILRNRGNTSMPESKKVRVVSRAESEAEKERPRKQPRAHISKEFKFNPFEAALRHLVIKENE